MNDIKKLIEDLKDVERGGTEAARDLRETDPKTSYLFYSLSEVCGKAAEELKRLIPVKREIEGGGFTWFYVCEECHGQVDSRDGFCRHCGHPLEVEWNRNRFSAR